MIITSDDQHTARTRRSGEVAVFERVPAAINARSFAVPEGRDSLMASMMTKSPQLLCAPNRRCREVLIDRRLKHNVLAQILAGTLHCLIEPTERRTSISRRIDSGAAPLRSATP